MGSGAVIRLLGPVGVLVGGALRPIASERQRSVLTLLAVEADRVVPRYRLADRLWGDDPPSDPAGALRTQISRLRRSLEPDGPRIETSDIGYRLVVDTHDVDLHRFERLVTGAAGSADELASLHEALSLWAGRPFDDVDLDSLSPLAARLDELRLSARERRARLLIAVGEADVADLEQLVREHPQREEARGLLMEALYLAGRHTEALAVYQEWRHHLADELGLTPSPALAALELAILDHRVGDDAPKEDLRRPQQRVPRPVTRILGRDADVAAAVAAIEQHRVVTLVGAGGVGKTRLALEVAAVSPRAAVFCDLAAIGTDADVDEVVAGAIDVDRRSGTPLRDSIAAHLDGRPALVILDNCEHVLAGTALLVEHLVQRSTGPTILATSRERLAVDGELLQTVEPLRVNEVDDPGVALFVERARVSDPGFEATRDRQAVRAICRRLDGLPLSIELAAAQVRSLGVAGLLQSFDAGPLRLEGGRRTTPRHRSVEAMVSWSYERLDVSERELFDRIAAFVGAFDVEAATAIADVDPARTRAGLVRLVETSMLVAVPTPDGPRYRMLQTLRDRGIEHLRAKEQEEATRHRHAQWAAAIAQEAALGVRTQLARDSAVAFAAHIDDLRAAHGWCVGRDLKLAVQLSASTHPLALWFGYDECFQWAAVTAAALAMAPTEGGAAVLASAAIGACRRGDLDEAASLATAASSADAASPALPASASALSEVALMRGDLDDAHSLFMVAAAAARDAGDPLETAWNLGSASLARTYAGCTDDALEIAMAVRADAEAAGSLAGQAFAEFVLGEAQSYTASDVALAHLERAIDLAESAGTAFVRGVAEVSLASLHARSDTEDSAVALTLYEQAINRWAGTGAWAPLRVTLRSLAGLLSVHGELHDAAAILAAAHHMTPLFGSDRDLVDRLTRTLRDALGDDEFTKASSDLLGSTPDEIGGRALAAIRRAAEINPTVPHRS